MVVVEADLPLAVGSMTPGGLPKTALMVDSLFAVAVGFWEGKYDF